MLLGVHFLDLLDFGKPHLAINARPIAYQPRRFICMFWCVPEGRVHLEHFQDD
jgi:hypothetical protein